MTSILFVDDEPVSTQALRAVLEARGYHCRIRTDMTSALTYIDADQPDVIVSDIMMPSGVDFPDIDSSEAGFRFVSTVRRKYPDISIICLSVIGDQEKIGALRSQGILYLRKGETPLEKATELIVSKATGTRSFEGPSK